jgi:hypothetical protein
MREGLKAADAIHAHQAGEFTARAIQLRQRW